MIYLDTGVVSAVLRRRKRGPREERLAARLTALLGSDLPVGLPGIVFQEILSGVVDRAQHRRLLASIRESFPVILATEDDHLRAADLVSSSAREGIALSTPDALIAAQALGRPAALFTTDADFYHLEDLAGLQVIHV